MNDALSNPHDKFVKIWELYLKQNKKAKTLPVVIPMVLYHGRKEWRAGLRFSDLISASEEELRIYIPDFSYLLYDLSAYSDDQIRGIVIIRAFLMALKYMQQPECADHLEKIFSLLEDTLSQPGRGLSFFESLIRYIFNTTDRVRVDELKEMVEKTITKDKEEIIMTLAEKLIQQGMQQGMQQGVQEGEIKMAQKAVLEVLETRFQEVPASLKVKLEGISDRAFLEDLLRQAVTVASLDELDKKIPLGNLS